MYHAYKFALVVFYLSLFKFFNLVLIFYSLLWNILIQASTENLTAHTSWFTQANFTTLFKCLGKMFRQFFWFLLFLLLLLLLLFCHFMKCRWYVMYNAESLKNKISPWKLGRVFLCIDYSPIVIKVSLPRNSLLTQTIPTFFI